MQKIPPRPQFHFTARRGWLNDPNGLVVLGSRYHMYFQHNPEAPEWGNIHWGHAVSDDLLHWEELPIALAPKAENDLCFSGSAFLDTENASGLGTPENPALLVYFTSTGRGECLAYSLDGGMTFTEYEDNPVIRHRGRDPRILRYAPGHYVIAVYDEVNHIAFYRSADLKNWTFCSRIHGFYECTELFELGGRWVLFGANGVYSLGSFDGEAFTPETLPRPLFEGDAYAGQTFANCGRRIAVFWLRDNGIFRSGGFSQQMSIPVELTLKDDRILVNPATQVPGSRVWSSPECPVTLRGIELPAAEHMLIIEDSASVEAFINHGERCILRSTSIPMQKEI